MLSQGSDRPFEDDFVSHQSYLKRKMNNSSSQGRPQTFHSNRPGRILTSSNQSREHGSSSQYIDDLVHVLASPEDKKGDAGFTNVRMRTKAENTQQQKYRFDGANQNFGQIEPRVVSLRLEPRTISSTVPVQQPTPSQKLAQEHKTLVNRNYN